MWRWGPILPVQSPLRPFSFVLFTAGSAIGLSLLSPYPFSSYGKWAATVAAFWAMFVPILSLLIGGYIAGRMRRAWSTNPDEVELSATASRASGVVDGGRNRRIAGLPCCRYSCSGRR